MVSSALAKRIKSLELLATPKQPMLVLHCLYEPDAEQREQIGRAEAAGRRIILFMLRPSTVWLSGEPKTWEAALCA